MFSCLARATTRRPRLILLAWLLVLLTGFSVGSSVFGNLHDQTSSGHGDAALGSRLLGTLSPAGGTVVMTFAGSAADVPGLREPLAAAVGDVSRLHGVASVSPAQVLPGTTTHPGDLTVVTVTLHKNLAGKAAAALATATEARFRQVPDPQVLAGGSVLMDRDSQQAAARDLQRGELVALPIALVILLLVFGGLLPALLPLLAAAASVAGALLVLLVASRCTTLSSYAVNAVTMLGLGLSIDYALLLVSRFREERAAGLSVEQATSRAVTTAGRTVVFSGITVALALSGLAAFPNPMFRSLAIGGTGVVVVAMLAAVTAVPAALRLVGHRVGAARQPDGAGAFARLAQLVQRRRLVVLALVGATLLAIGAPVLHAKYTMGSVASLPAGAQSRQVAEQVQQRAGGDSTAPITVVDAQGAPVGWTGYLEQAGRLPGVAWVEPVPLTSGVAVHVTMAGSGQGDQARAAVTWLRAHRPSADVHVTGQAAALADFGQMVRASLPAALGWTFGALFVLLFLMTGSLAIPAKALVTNLLSQAATLGVLVTVFQDGPVSRLLGFPHGGSLEAVIPVIAAVFAFALSMDYEVFLIARVKELHEAGVPTDEAVALGLQRSGKIITSAAALMIVVFGGFASGQLLALKEMGVALATAVLVDATVVRCLLVPATMTLLGHRNWWAPAPLRQLHARLGLREAPAVPVTVVPLPATLALPVVVREPAEAA